VLLKRILSDQFKLLLCQPFRPDLQAHYRAYLLYGLVVTWLAGIGRYWDCLREREETPAGWLLTPACGREAGREGADGLVRLQCTNCSLWNSPLPALARIPLPHAEVGRNFSRLVSQARSREREETSACWLLSPACGREAGREGADGLARLQHKDCSLWNSPLPALARIPLPLAGEGRNLSWLAPLARLRERGRERGRAQNNQCAPGAVAATTTNSPGMRYPSSCRKAAIDCR